MPYEDYTPKIVAGQDCLDPEMKRQRIETKARILEGRPITDEEILQEAEQNAENSKFKGLCDPGPLTD